MTVSRALIISLALTACAANAGQRPAPTARATASSTPRGGVEVQPTAPPESPSQAQQPAASVPADQPAWLGVELAKRDGDAGVLVRSVMHGSPAERAGLTSGDVVVSIDGQNVARPGELRERVMRTRPGSRVSLGVQRGDVTRLFAVELEPMPSDDEVMRRNYVGATAPDFGSLDSVQGSVTPNLAALKGRVVVLEFWASWCGVCHVMAPTLNGWHDRYSAQGLTVLGVTNDPVDVAGRSAGEIGIGYPIASDGSGNMLRAYRAFALPTLFVIDKQGKVRDVLIGYSTPRLREIEALVQRLIAES